MCVPETSAPPRRQLSQIDESFDNGPYDRHWLSLDRDGTILVTSAKTSGDGFLTKRLEVDDAHSSVNVTAIYTVSDERLVSAPFTSPRTYGFLVEKANRIRLERVTALPARPPCNLEEDDDQ